MHGNWTGKSRVDQPYTENWKNSQDRIFGLKTLKYSSIRADFLAKCENGGKNYNIVN